MFLKTAQIVDCTEAEGPGRRFAIWTQGCPLHCPGCCNPEFIPETGGTLLSIEEIVKQVELAHQKHRIEGVTFLGGEPLAQLESVAALASEIKIRNLSVVVFSGYTIEEIQSRLNPAAQQLLSVTDILIDGRYLKDQPDTKRRWIGSTNQRIHFLTDRYKPNDSYWQKSNTLEIRVSGNELSVNGFPSIGGKALWRRPKPLSE